jgi:hypothetical protein
MQETKKKEPVLLKEPVSPPTDHSRLHYEEKDSSLSTMFWIGGFLLLTIALYLIGQGS